jgi:hypothetical protein
MSIEDRYCKARYMPPQDDNEAFSMSALPVKRSFAYPEEGMNHILLAGCSSTEYSYDASFNGVPMGAFSHNALIILRDNPNITHRDFFAILKTRLPSSAYPQTPQLECKEEFKDTKFFWTA